MSRYKRSLVTALIVSSVLSVSIAFAQLKTSPVSLASLQAGEYLSQSYLSRLKATGSPYRASMTNARHRGAKDEGTRLRTIYNFHEGGPEIVVSEDGRISVPIEAEERIGTPIVGSHSPNQFVLSFHGLTSQRFVFVGKASTVVAEMVLAGKYVDNSTRFSYCKRTVMRFFRSMNFLTRLE